MVTYTIKKQPGVPLYEALYRCIRADILSGALAPGQKLPSKRALAANLEVSLVTVEAAYGQLLTEGYICAREKVGYFVEQLEAARPALPRPAPAPQPEASNGLIDLVANGTTDFPFSIWSRLQRQVLQDVGKQLLRPMHNQGVWSLRCAIAEHLEAFRGLHAHPDQILVGAGTDFLYNLLIQLLGREKRYAVEEPGYGKIRRIYAAGGVTCVSARMDEQGVLPPRDAQVLHISPAHHFPTGTVTSMKRRSELLQWVRQTPSRYIIEDDYDSEFRFHAHPLPTLASLDDSGQVIYMNTFTKTLSPSIRISYMVLPAGLMKQFQTHLGFYSCTVPSFEQYTLERFLTGGWFEKHINRLRRAYKNRRNRIISLLQSCSLACKFTILEQDAGLHFLLKVDTWLTDRQLTDRCLELGIRIASLGDYYHDSPAADTHCLVVNYSALDDAALDRLEQRMQELKL